MIKVLVTIATAILMSTSAQAADPAYEQFRRMDWTHKVEFLKARGAEYRRDCLGFELGQVADCYHTMMLPMKSTFIRLRASMAQPRLRQWCLGSDTDAEMICFDQDTGERIDFVLHNDEWVAVQQHLQSGD